MRAFINAAFALKQSARALKAAVSALKKATIALIASTFARALIKFQPYEKVWQNKKIH
ncbi:hypothetical protein SLU01_00140 [Sporosarcina luteola]|uniref:Uncharacterized protein n=1 Tax=Sporosarcina luteola TaxID=582850 RepID=A0A511Z2M9_9BACL|nr:hypothetical protein [Sporosarcina luteola]GEN81702.1 hypothetical protein SLU01_00140 [Sporosarcina luteola]